jgi:hypothetical protein
MDLGVFFKNYSTLYLGFSAFSIEHSEVYEIHSWDFVAISDESSKHLNIIKIVLPSVAAGLLLVALVLCIRYCNCILFLWTFYLGPFFQVPQAEVEMVGTRA